MAVKVCPCYNLYGVVFLLCCTIALGARVYDLTADEEEDFPCLHLQADSGPHVCWYNSVEDNNLHASFDSPTISKIISELRANIGLIDVGARLGINTLVAADSGRDVLAVEPLAGNVRRLHRAIKMGKYVHRVTLLNNHVTGDPVIIEDGKKIHLDSLAPYCQFRKAVLRLDLAGNEYRAMRHSSELMKDIDITHIFMNWDTQTVRTYDEDVAGIHQMVSVLSKKGYVPRTIHGEVLEGKKWQSWTGHMYWQKM